MNHDIYKSSFILFLIGLSGYLFNFLFNAILANHISSELYGDFSVAFRLLNIVSMYMLLGTIGASKRFYSNYLKTNDIENASRYMAWNIKLLIFSMAIFCFLLSVFSIVVFGLHLFHVHDIKEYHLVVYFLWLSPINAIALLISTYLVCDRDIYWGAFFDYSGFYLFGLILLPILIYFFHVYLHSEYLWFLVFCASALMALLQFIILMGRVPHILKSAFTLIFNFRESDGVKEKEWWAVSRRLTLNQIAYLLIRAADLFLLELLSVNQKVVGYYAAALTISGVFLITQTALFQLPTTLFSTLVAHPEKKPALQKLVDESNHMNIALNFALIAIVFMFSSSILGFFGQEFIAAKTSLWILLIGVGIGVFTSSANRLLAYTGHEAYLFYIAVTEVFITVFFGFVLIKWYGMIGAASTVLLSTLFKSLVSVYLVRKKLNVRSSILF